MSTILDALNKASKERTGSSQPPSPPEPPKPPAPPQKPHREPGQQPPDKGKKILIFIVAFVFIFSTAAIIFHIKTKMYKDDSNIKRSESASTIQQTATDEIKIIVEKPKPIFTPEPKPKHDTILKIDLSELKKHRDEMAASDDEKKEETPILQIPSPKETEIMLTPIPEKTIPENTPVIIKNTPIPPKETVIFPKETAISKPNYTPIPSPEITPPKIIQVSIPEPSPIIISIPEEPAKTPAKTPTPDLAAKSFHTYSVEKQLPKTVVEVKKPQIIKTEASTLRLKFEGIMYDEKNPNCIINNKILSVDDEIEGYKIIKIEKTSIIIEKDGFQYQLKPGS